MRKTALDCTWDELPQGNRNASLKLVPDGAPESDPTAPDAAPVLIDGESAALLKLLLKDAAAAHSAQTIPREVLQRVSKDWIFEMKHARGLSRCTTDSYEYTLKVLFHWFDESGHKQCSETEIRAFFDSLTRRFENPPAESHVSASQPGARMRQAHFNNLRAMFNWAIKRGYFSRSPMANVPTPRLKEPNVQPFTEEHLKRLLAAAKCSLNAKRDYALLLLMLDCGLRASELCSLILSDVDFEQRTVTVRHGKGDKARMVDFSPETMTAMWNYLRGQPRNPNDALFRSQRGTGSGKCMTRNGLRQLFERLGEAAGITDVRCSPHTMRHAFASSYIMDGGAVEDLQKLMGHTRPTMSMKYVELNREHIKRQHLRHSPVSRLMRQKK